MKTASSFLLSNSAISNISLDDAGTFTIRPTDDLLPGDYSATVLVSGTDISPQSFEVSFKVNPRTGNDIISVSELTNFTFAGTNIFANVDNDVSYINLFLTVSDGAIWTLYNDIACTDENADKSMFLSVGTNIAFIEVSAENGSKKLYALVIVRKESQPLQGTMNLVISERDGTLQLETGLDDLESVTWTIVSGQEFASINQSGLVTAKKDGIAIIQVTSQNGAYQEFKVTITGQSGNPNTGYDSYVYFGLLVLITSGALYNLYRKLCFVK